MAGDFFFLGAVSKKVDVGVVLQPLLEAGHPFIKVGLVDPQLGMADVANDGEWGGDDGLEGNFGLFCVLSQFGDRRRGC